MDEHLIELVRSYPELYDLSSKKYMDTGHKNHIWDNIGEELNLEGTACKARWSNIRDQYRKYLKKSNTRSGQSGKQTKPYKFAQLLGFLQKTFEERATKESIEFSKDRAEDNDGSESIVVDEDTAQCSSDPTISINIGGEFNESRSNQAPKTPITQPQQTPRKRPATKASASSQLMEYLIKKKDEEPTTSALTLTHPIDAFLIGIGASLKTFSPLDLISAKRDIFNIIQKYELKMATTSKSNESQGRCSETCASCQHSNILSHDDMTRSSFEVVETENLEVIADDVSETPHSNTSSRNITPTVSPVANKQYPNLNQSALRSFFLDY